MTGLLRGAVRVARLWTRQGGTAALEAVISLLARFRPGVHDCTVPDSILVLRPNDLGDLLVVTPLFDALRRRFPESKIVVAVGSWSLPILAGNPHLSEVLATDAPWANKFVRRQGWARRIAWIVRSPAARDMARRRFAVGIDVLGSHWGALLLLRVGVHHRLGMRGYAGGHSAMHRAIEFDPREHVGRSALRFAELLGATDLPSCRPQLYLSPEEREAGEARWRAGTGTRVVLGPGAGLAAKVWPLARWDALTRRLAELGSVDVVVTGGSDDRSAGERLAASAGVRNLTGLGLRETFALVATADLVFCHSSMLLHAAAAFGKPTVVLLGPSFPSARQHDEQWGYPSTCISLGRESGVRNDLATPDEALAAARVLIASAPRREVA